MQSGQPYWYVSTGTANAINVTAAPAWPAYGAGKMLVIKKNTVPNTGPVTINVNSLGTRSIVMQDGSALVDGEMLANSMYILVDDGAQFLLLNPEPVSTKFRAGLSVSQTGIATSTKTKIVFDSEVYDIGSQFSSGTFTAKRAGYYEFYASIQSSGLGAGNYSQVFIYKNGGADSSHYVYSEGAPGPMVSVTTNIYLAVDDYVEVYWEHNSGTNEDVNASESMFFGHGPL